MPLDGNKSAQVSTEAAVLLLSAVLFQISGDVCVTAAFPVAASACHVVYKYLFVAVPVKCKSVKRRSSCHLCGNLVASHENPDTEP